MAERVDASLSRSTGDRYTEQGRHSAAVTATGRAGSNPVALRKVAQKEKEEALKIYMATCASRQSIFFATRELAEKFASAFTMSTAPAVSAVEVMSDRNVVMLTDCRECVDCVERTGPEGGDAVCCSADRQMKPTHTVPKEYPVPKWCPKLTA